MTTHEQNPEHGAVVEVPLNKLKASPRNARGTPHKPDDVAALAASIGAKGLLQPLVVEPETNETGEPTGFYLVTIGEGRRQAMALRAKRKEIKRSDPVRCVIDTANDAYEISLDENVTRFAMHPADQFEAFHRLIDERGFGIDDVAARFGVTPTVVRQRLKLAKVSPKLMKRYRDGEMSLDQLMAFTLTDDHLRQEAVWDSLTWNHDPSLIRRMLPQDRVRATDRRAKLVGPEAYMAAGGLIERDLFAEDGGGYFADPVLLDRLAMAQLEAAAADLIGQGWKWATPSLNAPETFGMGRIYQTAHDLAPEEQTRFDALMAEYDDLATAHDDDEAYSPEVADRIKTLGEQLQALEDSRRAYDPDQMARAGAFVTVGPGGDIQVQPGFVRAEDQPPVEEPPPWEDDPAHPDEAKPLSEKLTNDLSAQFTAGLADRIGQSPDLALAAVVHALTLQAFGQVFGASCLEISLRQPHLPSYAPTIAEGLASTALQARHAEWASELPGSSEALWAFILALPQTRKLALLAHCAALSVNAVNAGVSRGGALAHAATLAAEAALDMADYWSPTVASYLGRVSKAQIVEAVVEGVSASDAERLAGLKKQTLAETAERLLEGKRWLPTLLRTQLPEAGLQHAAE
jgi:ParB family chromosome partitioning protein